MHVLFVEPCFPRYQIKFVRGLVAAGAMVSGISEVPLESAPREVRELLHGYAHVRSVVHPQEMTDAVAMLQAKGPWVHRLEATVEAHVLVAAQVREARGIPGTSARTAYLCRDKPAMKEALRAAGVPCAASDAVASEADALEFARRVGYPLVLKPADAAGAAGVVRVDSDEELVRELGPMGLAMGARVAIEEFVEGHEGFYDTLSINGVPAIEFVSHYYPGVLEAMRTRWISPQIVTTNRLDAPAYEQLRSMSARVHRALGIETSATHMEWFFGPKGLRFSEIACRPPGVGMWDIYDFANDFSLYEQWAHAVCHGRIAQHPSRRYCGGMIALRPDRDGTIVGCEGLATIEARYHQHFVDGHIPPAGASTSPVEGGYWANGWLRYRHPDYDGLRALLDDVGQTLQLRAR